jgi:hypothetical protein
LRPDNHNSRCGPGGLAWPRRGSPCCVARGPARGLAMVDVEAIWRRGMANCTDHGVCGPKTLGVLTWGLFFRARLGHFLLAFRPARLIIVHAWMDGELIERLGSLPGWVDGSPTSLRRRADRTTGLCPCAQPLARTSSTSPALGMKIILLPHMRQKSKVHFNSFYIAKFGQYLPPYKRTDARTNADRVA